MKHKLQIPSEAKPPLIFCHFFQTISSSSSSSSDAIAISTLTRPTESDLLIDFDQLSPPNSSNKIPKLVLQTPEHQGKKIFKTASFLENKKLIFDQIVCRYHATMQQDVLLHFWIIFLYSNQAEI